MHVAAGNGHAAAVRALIEADADIYARNEVRAAQEACAGVRCRGAAPVPCLRASGARPREARERGASGRTAWGLGR